MTKQLKLDLVLVGDNNQVTQDCIKSLGDNDFNIIVEPFDGYNKSLNNGAKKGNGDYIAFCNNDLEFHEGWIEPLVETLERYDSVSPWCPKTHKQWWKGTNMFGDIYSSYEIGKCIAGWFIMMKRSTWEKLGGFDERLSFWCCDNAYGEQIKALGMKHALVYTSKVTHLQSTTLNKQSKETFNKLTREQVKIFNRIYGKDLFGLGQ